MHYEDSPLYDAYHEITSSYTPISNKYITILTTVLSFL